MVTINGKQLKFITVNLTGSRLYNLHGKDSDYDYTVLYKRNVKDYLTLNEFYEDSMPDSTHAESRCSYTRWDVKKFLHLAGIHSWKAYEVLCAKEAYHDNPDYQIIKRDVKPENFALKPILFSCSGLIHNNKQRGYMQAYFWLIVNYILQHNALPSDLNAWNVLNAVDLTREEKVHLTYLFYQKINGVKNEPFNLPDVNRELFRAFPEPVKYDYTATFHEILGVH